MNGGTRCRRCRSAVVLAALACLVLGSPAHGQVSNGDGTDRWLKVDWKADRTTISGRIYNQYVSPADQVKVLVEALDASGRVIDKRYEWVGGVIPALGNRYFEVSKLRAAHHYRVSVASYTFVLGPSRRRF